MHDNNRTGNPEFQSGKITVNGQTGSTQRRSNGETMCYSGFAGNAWMILSGNGVDLETPKVRWP